MSDLKISSLYPQLLMTLLIGTTIASRVEAVEIDAPIDSLASLTSAAVDADTADATVRMRWTLGCLAFAKQQKIGPEQALARAFQQNNLTGIRAEITRQQILTNWNYAVNAGLLTPQNLQRLKDGEPPLISRGNAKGQVAVEVRLVSAMAYPEFAQELANIKLFPPATAQRRIRSGNLTDAAHLARLQAMVAEESGVTPTQSSIPTSIPQETAPWYEDFEIPLNQAVHMSAFGGPDLYLTVRSESTSSISYNISDPTQLQSVIRYDSYGYAQTVMLPTTTTLKVAKSNGVKVPGRISRLYPLYQNDYLTVYFYDTLATSQNYRMLVIAHEGGDGT